MSGDELALPHEAADSRLRLARAFDVTQTRLALPLATTALLALLGVPAGAIGFMGAGAMLAGVAAMRAAEARQITAGLREVDGWGFPVEGYREWLLAHAPAFDLELASEVAVDVIETAAAAVEALVFVERRGDRVVRIITRPIELPATKHHPPCKVGDRRLLFELRDRILAPLHADVGIVAMRMGDRDSLRALVASPRAAHVGSAFRDQAMTAPPALQALVHAGTAQLRPANEARGLRLRVDRVIYANGEAPVGTGAVGWLMLVGTVVGGMIVGVGGAVGGGLLAFGASLGVLVTSNRARALAIAESAGAAGFPIEGYDDWLLSGRPIFDVELAAAVDRSWVDFSLRGHDYELSWLDDTLLRIETEPRLVHPRNTAIRPFWGGNRLLFQAITAKLLVPLHAKVGIVAVRMGGYVDRRG